MTALNKIFGTLCAGVVVGASPLYTANAIGTMSDETQSRREMTTEGFSAAEAESIGQITYTPAAELTKKDALQEHVGEQDSLKQPTRINELFPDAILAGIIAEQLEKSGVDAMTTQEELEQITSIYYWRPSVDRRISNLAGLQHLTNLLSLNLYFNDVTDITPLARLLNLQELDLSYNKIKNITPLRRLVGLQKLSLRGTKVKDLFDLATLVNLSDLDISELGVNDVRGLASLNKLMFLNLGFNAYNRLNLTPLRQLPLLETLHLHHTNLLNEQLLPVLNLTNLRVLDVAGNQLTNITPLQSLRRLQVLNIEQRGCATITSTDWAQWNSAECWRRKKVGKINDFSVLASFPQLENLTIRNNNLDSIEVVPAQALRRLQVLDASENKFTDIDEFTSLTNLHRLTLHSNHFRELSPLQSATFPNLELLDLRYNYIHDITALGTTYLPKLETLDIYNQFLWNPYDNGVATQYIQYKEPMVVENVVRGANGEVIPPSRISNNGVYDAPNMRWDIVMPKRTRLLTYDWWQEVEVAGVRTRFNGTYYVGIVGYHHARFIVNEQAAHVLDVSYDAVIDRPSDPIKRGYSFIGWYTAETGGRVWDFVHDTMPAEDLTLYARYEKEPFNPNWQLQAADVTLDETELTILQAEKRLDEVFMMQADVQVVDATTGALVYNRTDVDFNIQNIDELMAIKMPGIYRIAIVYDHEQTMAASNQLTTSAQLTVSSTVTEEPDNPQTNESNDGDGSNDASKEEGLDDNGLGHSSDNSSGLPRTGNYTIERISFSIAVMLCASTLARIGLVQRRRKEKSPFSIK
jgi:uncharacterized repeat protein (TIGR02543 family)